MAIPNLENKLEKNYKHQSYQFTDFCLKRHNNGMQIHILTAVGFEPMTL